MSGAKHTREQTKAELRRICGLPFFHERCAGVDSIVAPLLDTNAELLAACKAALVVGEIRFGTCALARQVQDKLQTAIARAKSRQR